MTSLVSPTRSWRAMSVPRQSIRFGLWLPLTPLFLLLAPVALIAAPLLRLPQGAQRLNTWRAAWALGAVLLSLSGTVVSVDAPRVQIRVRIL
jgi:hypothetical protein